MYVVMQVSVARRNHAALVALCFVISLGLHGGAVYVLPVALAQLGMHSRQAKKQQTPQRRQRSVRVVRENPQPKQFVKTDPDQQEQAPEEADFIGKRNTVESAAEIAPQRWEDAPRPTQNGEERDEIVTFDMKEQEGELEHDGAVSTGEAAPQMEKEPSEKAPTAPEAQQTENQETPIPEDGTAAVAPPPRADAEDLLIQNNPDEQEKPESPVKVDVAKRPETVRPSAAEQGYYDPSLAEHMQPQRGFRTKEKRTRSTGRFVLGRKPSLNVSATPLGRYQEEIYRRIAYYWYRACDDHRGDIIPGSITVSLRINARGSLVNMDLIKRRGAGVIQQSFTFGAIRRASLPPMPPQVRQEMVGDILELIFQFNFD